MTYPATPTHTSEVRLADELSATSLNQLAAGDVDVIWHRSFYRPEQCEKVLPAITAACETATYTLTVDLQSIGTSVGEAAESEANHRRYLSEAPATTRRIRDDILDGVLAPVDRLRLLLDELWPHGATVARDASGDRHLLPGILRRWPSGGHANPHIDQTETSVLGHLGLRRRIGCNVYMQLPGVGGGGEIEFWPRIAADEYARMRRPDYGLDRSKLGEPAFSVLPSQGDLVMFDASLIHGVAAIRGGARVTAACFVGVRDRDLPLVTFA